MAPNHFQELPILAQPPSRFIWQFECVAGGANQREVIDVRFYFEYHEDNLQVWFEIDAATIGTLAQVMLWAIGKHLGWF